MVNRAGRGHGWKPLRVHLGICIVRSAIRHFKIDLTLADLCGLLEEVRDTPAACRSPQGVRTTDTPASGVQRKQSPSEAAVGLGYRPREMSG